MGEHQIESKTELRARDRWLILAFCLGPLAVLTHLNVSYALVAESCARGSKNLLHLSAAVFLLVALAGAAIGWPLYRRFASAEGVLWQERTRWVALVATVLSLASAVVIIAMEIPNVLLRSCD
jgi:hypothetical protein